MVPQLHLHAGQRFARRVEDHAAQRLCGLENWIPGDLLAGREIERHGRHRRAEFGEQALRASREIREHELAQIVAGGRERPRIAPFELDRGPDQRLPGRVANGPGDPRASLQTDREVAVASPFGEHFAAVGPVVGGVHEHDSLTGFDAIEMEVAARIRGDEATRWIDAPFARRVAGDPTTLQTDLHHRRGERCAVSAVDAPGHARTLATQAQRHFLLATFVERVQEGHDVPRGNRTEKTRA